jgi:hypothetical protein
MANPWFRLYAEIVTDPKVIIVTEALRWRYVALLCIHCNEQYENAPDDEIALSLRVTVDEWLETKKTFIQRKLLNPDGSIKGWEKRQYISDLKDPTASERQKRYRENKKLYRNAGVTSRLPESDTDTDTDKKTYTPRALLEAENIPKQLIDDWLKIRKEKRQPLTITSLKSTKREAIKAKLSLVEVIEICCEKSWAGFNASYLNNQSEKNDNWMAKAK